MNVDALGVLETTGLTPAMVALDVMFRTAAIEVLQLELNDLYGVCLKITGALADVQAALEAGRAVADRMGGRPVTDLIERPDPGALGAVMSPPETNPLIQQAVVFPTAPSRAAAAAEAKDSNATMSIERPQALGFIETQGFTAVIEAVDTACKAAHVNVVGKEKLGGGYVTIVIEGELSAVEAAVAAAREAVGDLGKLIAAHVIARPNPGILGLLPKL